MVNKIFVGDVGTNIILRTGEDLTDITTIVFKIEKPDETIISRTGYLYDDGTNTKIHYVTQATDIDIVGKYRVQGVCDFINPSRHFSTEIAEIQVYEALG